MVKRIERNFLFGDTQYKVYMSCSTKARSCVVYIEIIDKSSDRGRTIVIARKTPNCWTVTTAKIHFVKMSYLEMKQELVKALIT